MSNERAKIHHTEQRVVIDQPIKPKNKEVKGMEHLNPTNIIILLAVLSVIFIRQTEKIFNTLLKYLPYAVLVGAIYLY